VKAIRRLVNGQRNVVRRERLRDDLDEELRATLELLVEEHQHRGIDPVSARLAARQELGSLAAIRDRVLVIRADALVDEGLWDIRYGTRLLRRNPIFAVTAALSLAIGIGAATAIVTVANALLLQAAPGLSEPDRLVDISKLQRGQSLSNPTVSYRTYLDLRERMTTVDRSGDGALHRHGGGRELSADASRGADRGGRSTTV